ncbi:MAG: 1-acyl-sn-glycerol-3-phosphate acyltransferase [Muribaculaceae bacterium]|nr:1-acyl-sn-glycerol-3-phosphate acyltransferase [Muribaculaceae bacterium]
MEEISRIDLDEILRRRLPRHYRFIPRVLIPGMERFICQDSLNNMLEVNRGLTGADFCRGVLEHLGIEYSVDGADNLPESGRAIFVCNHPLGGLDGIILIDMLTRRYHTEVKFVVNDLLMAIHPLRNVFIPVNKFGRQERNATSELDKAMASDAPIIVFPAGLVSRKQKGGHIADMRWHKMFVNKAVRYRRDIIPMFFNGQNSSFFYNFAKLRTRIGLKFNIEMVRLPAEVFRCKDARFSVKIGTPIPYATLSGGPEAQAEADAIRTQVYRFSEWTNR